jgi:endonuclease YncB( thermonuclease family)
VQIVNKVLTVSLGRSAQGVQRLLPLLLVAGAAAAGPAAARDSAPVEGVVTKVIDGDTLVVQIAGKPPLDVRLKDIDAPEICQQHGPEAKKALEEFALGKTATVVTSARDSFGRTIATLTVDGQNLSRRMVSEGHAWSSRFKYDRGPLVKEERQAKALNRGLHQQFGAQMPRDFRRSKGPCPKPA